MKLNRLLPFIVLIGLAHCHEVNRPDDHLGYYAQIGSSPFTKYNQLVIVRDTELLFRYYEIGLPWVTQSYVLVQGEYRTTDDQLQLKFSPGQLCVSDGQETECFVKVEDVEQFLTDTEVADLFNFKHQAASTDYQLDSAELEYYHSAMEQIVFKHKLMLEVDSAGLKPLELDDCIVCD
ncbi:hypothetical protein [Lewinella sp. 4G2]|uniref:hypothetical protein n=1 Tax=Lewinella sp. 4G2 TaxID=1803372 RepID=UPI0007B4CB0E|nr:hypothetical protein [Lewinella sp. 4G2]OAV43549.1 hypothetical protein A3850_003135 [Lewinella sp. 4G2]